MSAAATIAARTLEDLGWPQLVEHWVKRCATSRGAAGVRAAALFAEPAEAERRVAEIGCARLLLGKDAALPFGGIEPVEAAVGRAEKGGMLEPAELVAIGHSARGLTRLRQHLREHAELVPQLGELGAQVEDFAHVYQPILEAFDPEGRLVDHASEALGPLRRAVAGVRAQLETRLASMVEDPRYAEFLQDSYYTQRDDRYVLPVRAQHKNYVHGIVHGTSQSGQTVFLEPDEIVDLNNRLKLAECDVADEERRILLKLTGWVAEDAADLQRGLAAAAVLDGIGAAARLAEDTIASAPEIVSAVGDGGGLHVLHARHPLMLLADRRCVANDVVMRPGGTLIVSGPNAGGKTVVLKTVGLLALMVRAGLHVPAERGSKVPWFARIESDIGDAQSLEMSLSTYSAHLLALRELVRGAGPDLLVLVDEISVGTEPEQGAAIAQAVLEALAERQVTAIVTTHYERLKALGAADPRFANASVGFDLARMEPTFKLHLGVPGSSGALAVARRLEIPETVVARARELLGSQGADVEELLAVLTEQRRRIEEERRALLDELEAAESERQAARAASDAAFERERKTQRAAHDEAVSALRRARDEIDALRAEARRRAASEGEVGIADVRRKVAVVAAEVARHEPARIALPGKRVPTETLIPGTPVVIVSLGARGEIASAPSKGKVVVRVGTMHTTADVDDVLLDTHKKAASVARRQPTGEAGGRDKDELGYPQALPVKLVAGDQDGRAGARTAEATVDVRGERADDAVQIIERFVDESLLAERDVVFVIHGHGTGALRNAVRSHAARHRGVTRWRAGAASEGGDGVTVLWLGAK